MRLITLATAVLTLALGATAVAGDENPDTDRPAEGGGTATSGPKLGPRTDPMPTGWSQKTINIMVGAVQRTVLADGPGSDTYSCGPVPYPIIISYHGRGSNPGRMRGLSQFHDQKYCSIVLYPSGLNGLGRDSTAMSYGTLKSCWQGAPYCTPKVPGTGPPETIRDDVAFFDALINLVRTEYGSWAALDRVYVSGKSNGAEFANYLACYHGDQIAAIAPVSGPFYYAMAGLDADPSCSPTHPIPVINFHGDADKAVKYQGSGRWESCLGNLCDPPDRVARIPNLPKWAAAWGDHNGCESQELDVPVPGAAQPSSGQETFLSKYYNCNGDVEVLHYHTKNGLHDWPSLSPNDDNTQDDQTFATVPAVLGTMNATEVIVQFFKRFTLRP
ncbi:unnamed protein product [Tuber aestivum]|uniref:feruloyl esterase n=1 Tax=Tuber aestivum TaxID=59557 RepID=A0A292PQ45_9PEZI|nr:unnamed protein product [Tuber aestivum]